MKTIVVIECKRCGQQYLGNDLSAAENGTPVALILKAIGRCSACKEGDDRSMGSRFKKKLRP